MTNELPPGFSERARKFGPVAAVLLIGGAIVWFSNVKQSGKDIAAGLDSEYHHRAADGALVQLARVPGGASKGPVQYMATFENRSDDPLLVVGVVYDVEEVAAATTTDMNATDFNATTTSADAGGMEATENYELRKPCKQGSQEPLVPPFRIKPHTTGSFAVTVDKDVTPAGAWGCNLEVRFKTNQGDTNGLVPDVD